MQPIQVRKRLGSATGFLGQILLRLPQPLKSPLDPLADRLAVEVLLWFPKQTDGKRIVKEWRASKPPNGLTSAT